MKKFRCIILTSFVLAVVLSTFTLVPFANSKPVMNKVETIEKTRMVFEKIFDLKFEKQSISNFFDEPRGVIWDLIVAIINVIVTFIQLFRGTIKLIMRMIENISSAVYNALVAILISVIFFIGPVALLAFIIGYVIQMLSGNQNSTLVT